MSDYFPVVIEREDNGSYSAWVAGVPGVYAAADTATIAKRDIRKALAAHLDALRALGRDPRSKAQVVLLRRTVRAGTTSRTDLRYTGIGAMLGRKTSAAKAAAARRNGRKGGRPRQAAERDR